MLDFSHNTWLVLASLAVSFMAAFTGLSLTQGASALNVPQRKLVVALAAIVLGGGIWSMHFVAMLGLELPIQFYYDALITLISALVAILMVGLALLILHFHPRTTGSITFAGVIVGFGIAVMHYVGMMGMELCRPVFGVGDVAISTAAAIVLSSVAIWVAYGARTHRNIVAGTLCFGFAVFAVHFIAMSRTGFIEIAGVGGSGPLLSNQTLALGVTISVFLICGAFLLTGVTFLAKPANAPGQLAVEPEASPVIEIAPDPDGAVRTSGVPYETEGHTRFADHASIAAVRAEGHYTVLYVDDAKLFCPWSISEAESRLGPAGFVRAHRSYLINPAHVSGFERTKDTGICYFDAVVSLPKVPVSRSRLGEVREVLGLA